MIPQRAPLLTDPSCASEWASDQTVENKCQNDPNCEAVRREAIRLIRMIRVCRSQGQVVAEVLRATRSSGQHSEEAIAETGFAMGFRFGFELGFSYPPLRKKV